MGRGNKKQEEEKKNTRNKALLHGFSHTALQVSERERERECVCIYRQTLLELQQHMKGYKALIARHIPSVCYYWKLLQFPPSFLFISFHFLSHCVCVQSSVCRLFLSLSLLFLPCSSDYILFFTPWIFPWWNYMNIRGEKKRSEKGMKMEGDLRKTDNSLSQQNI